MQEAATLQPKTLTSLHQLRHVSRPSHPQPRPLQCSTPANRPTPWEYQVQEILAPVEPKGVLDGFGGFGGFDVDPKKQK